LGKTSKEIADLCGVSRGTVYRALNDRPGIKPETKEKILKVAAEVGYRPNFIAQSLVKKKTMTLGIVLFDINNRIFSQIANAIESRARKLGYFVYLTLTHKDPDLEKEYIRYLVDRKVDGIIIIPVNKGKEFEDYLTQFKIPIVTFGNKISNKFPHIWINDRQAIVDSVQFLNSKGYNKILYIASALSNSDPKINKYGPEQRLLGFYDAINTFPNINSIIIKESNFINVIENIQFNKRDRTAILCPSDIYALQIIKYAKLNGLKIPYDFGLMGFDNIDTLQYISPSLATVGFSIEGAGNQLVDVLVKQINREDMININLLSHEIIYGESV